MIFPPWIYCSMFWVSISLYIAHVLLAYVGTALVCLGRNYLSISLPIVKSHVYHGSSTLFLVKSHFPSIDPIFPVKSHVFVMFNSWSHFSERNPHVLFQVQDFESIHLLVPLSAVFEVHVAMSHMIHLGRVAMRGSDNSRTFQRYHRYYRNWPWDETRFFLGQYHRLGYMLLCCMFLRFHGC